eukprot:718701_1
MIPINVKNTFLRNVNLAMTSSMQWKKKNMLLKELMMPSLFVKVSILYVSVLTCTYSSFIFNGCDSSSWSESYYPSKIFPESNTSDDCMIIPSDGLGSMQITDRTWNINDQNHDKIMPTLWFDIGSESALYYNISFDLRCNLQSIESLNHFEIMFRVQSLFARATFENNKNFAGYAFRANCGYEFNVISIKQYPSSETMITNPDLNHHQFDLNSGHSYNIQIIVGDKAQSDPRLHKVYINNKLVLQFHDSTYLYGGIGLCALIADGITLSRQKVSTFYVHDFIATGIGFDDTANNIQCEETGKIKHINWMDLSRNASLKPDINFQMDVNQAELALYIRVELDYVGYSYCDRLETYGYGTTYVLDFESFDAHKSAIHKPGTCANRLCDSFLHHNHSFADWWSYSDYPYLEDGIGCMHEHLAYPKPSSYWYMYMKYSQCTPIVYEGKFNLNDLKNCGNHDDTRRYLEFVNDDEWMNITGTFYVNLVSPMNKDIEIGYYYVYQLLAAPFVISIKKTINIMSSSGISLFTMTFVSVYKQENEPKYSLILLTESTDYLYLTFNQLLDAPDSSLQIVEDETECLTLRQNMCSQLFEITAYPVLCAGDMFNGQYGIRFNIQCNPDLMIDGDDTTDNVCSEWLDAEIEAIQDNTVDLFIDLQFEDMICDTRLYLIEFNAEMEFFIDDGFSNVQADARNGYEIGVDRIYVSIILDFNGAYDILEANLINVWLCTIDETYQDNEAFVVSQSGDEGGCFATDIIDENQPYHLVQNGYIGVGYDSLDAIIYDRDIGDGHLFPANEVRFSFMVPTNIVRDKLYIHAQVTIKLVSQDEDTDVPVSNRRILTEQVDVQDQVRHFMHYTRIQQSTSNGDTASPNEHTASNGWVDYVLEWMDLKTIVFLIICAVLLAMGTTLFILNKRRERNRRSTRINQYVTQ